VPGIYIHIPFCTRKCAYCDFYSLPASPHLLQRYTQALVADIRRRPHGSFPAAASVYLGGGTPSLLSPAQVGAILDAVAASHDLLPGVEVSVEVNPAPLRAGFARGLAAAGVTRVSLGVQTFQPALLRGLGRRQRPEDVAPAVHQFRRAGISSLGVDLVLGGPGMTTASVAEDLRRTLEMAPEHVSAYLLALEPGTPLARAVAAGRVDLPGEDEEASQYETAREVLTSVGYRHYELSNFALPGHACRHNLGYWEGQDYLGYGPGAVSLVSGVRSMVRADLYSYLREVEAGRPPQRVVLETLGAVDRVRERLLMGLRLTEGVCAAQLEAEFGPEATRPLLAVLQPAAAAGLLEYAGNRVRLTGRGQLLANEVFRALVG
jgi:oxygen-independent coproporphyrinogen-3 oxidase